MKKQMIIATELLLTAFIWGVAFVAQSVGMDYIGPFTFNCVRSVIGGLVLIPLILVLKKVNKEKITDSVVKHTVKTIELDRRMVTDEEYAIALADHERFNAEPFVPSTDKSPEENL